MIKNVTLAILLLSSVQFSGLSQSGTISKDSLQTKEKVFHATISINPFFMYSGINQIYFGANIEKSKFGCSLTLNSGFLLDYFNYAIFVESTFKFYEKKSKNQHLISLRVPLWIGYRNFIPRSLGEEHYLSDFKTYLQIGTGINIRYNFSKRFSLFSNIGIGAGPKYINAGDFNFSNFKYEGIKILPKLGLAIAFHFWK